MDLSSSRIEQLIHAPERYKVVETPGWQPGIWGAFFIVVACLFVLPAKAPLVPLEWVISGGSAALGLTLAGYEVHRRRNRTVLVREGANIKVFRKGHLDLALAPEEITIVKADLVTMLKIGIPLGLCAAMFTATGMTGILEDRTVLVDDLIILCLGLTCGASLASAAWTRFTCVHLRVPIKGSGWLVEETILVPASRLKELFPPGPDYPYRR
jgi:hypothetical protein